MKHSSWTNENLTSHPVHLSSLSPATTSKFLGIEGAARVVIVNVGPRYETSVLVSRAEIINYTTNGHRAAITRREDATSSASPPIPSRVSEYIDARGIAIRVLERRVMHGGYGRVEENDELDTLS